jgi:hypothetical protein
MLGWRLDDRTLWRLSVLAPLGVSNSHEPATVVSRQGRPPHDAGSQKRIHHRTLSGVG